MLKENLRSNLAFASALAFLAVASACGGNSPSSAGSSPAGSGPAASPTAASSGTIAEDLTFTGPLAGHMTSAGRGDTYVCTGSNTQFVAGPIVGDVGSKKVSLNITKVSFHGPGSYPGGGVGFDEGSNHYYPATGASQTGLVVNPDLRSGSMDLDLAANSDPNTVVGHVTGTWRCPPDAF
jgi:hypothetical protein